MLKVLLCDDLDWQDGFLELVIHKDKRYPLRDLLVPISFVFDSIVITDRY